MSIMLCGILHLTACLRARHGREATWLSYIFYDLGKEEAVVIWLC
ncbi:hypothetical protein SDC9_202984 [bioreactor metagenome]|uniref:Uncharacterized protein n=1 Tax=bioreactor metagenome TaxID=1076179 RepID=A0A645IWP9_9ZZZZ